jgi:hypothetical protein
LEKSVVFGGLFVNDTVFKKYIFGHMSHEKFISRFFKSVLFHRFLVCKRRPLTLTAAERKKSPQCGDLVGGENFDD